VTEVAPIQRFDRTVGITYSGAETAESSLKALCVYQTVKGGPAEEVAPPDGVKRYWSRYALADWLRERLAEDIPTIIGLDHALSFPMRYYEVHRLPPDWSAFLTDFRAHWPTDRPHTYVDFVRDGITGRGAERMGDPSWLRLTDEAVRAAKSVFQFSGHGSVAKATHLGCHGSIISAGPARPFISGPSTAGRYPPARQPWSRSARPCGKVFMTKVRAHRPSTAPLHLQAGYGTRIWTVECLRLFRPSCHRRSRPARSSRDGYFRKQDATRAVFDQHAYHRPGAESARD
jgi:hypothetical protein